MSYGMEVLISIYLIVMLVGVVTVIVMMVREIKRSSERWAEFERLHNELMRQWDALREDSND